MTRSQNIGAWWMVSKLVTRLLYFPPRPISTEQPVARVSNVPKLFGWHESFCIFHKSKFQALKLDNNFAFPCIWNILKSSFSRQPGFKNCFSGPISYRVFRETAPCLKAIVLVSAVTLIQESLPPCGIYQICYSRLLRGWPIVNFIQ